MKKVFIVFITSVLLQACQNIDGANSNSKTFDTSIYRSIKSFNVYEFKINNQNINEIGYQTWDDDEHVGVKGISIEKQFVYLTDVYHNNIKRINIETGELFSSEIIDSIAGDDLIWLRDLTYFNNKIYVTSDRSKVYILNKDLSKEGEITTIVSRKYIFNQSEDSLKIFLKNEQKKDLTMQVDLLLVTNDNQTKNISENVSLEKYKTSLEALSVNGKPYEVFSKDGKEYIRAEFGLLELKSKIPEITNYDCSNVQFTKNVLVYFESTPEKFILYVYKLK